jgi:hypothetical protein
VCVGFYFLIVYFNYALIQVSTVRRMLYCLLGFLYMGGHFAFVQIGTSTGLLGDKKILANLSTT